jgi:hypothetical protein
MKLKELRMKFVNGKLMYGIINSLIFNSPYYLSLFNFINGINRGVLSL